MRNLNKENFWNEMYQKYPLAMKEFCQWIDEYKQRVSWNHLFGNDVKNIPTQIKFHDIPLAMQMGIWNEYCGKYNLQECKESISSFLNGFEEGQIEQKNYCEHDWIFISFDKGFQCVKCKAFDKENKFYDIASALNIKCKVCGHADCVCHIPFI